MYNSIKIPLIRKLFTMNILNYNFVVALVASLDNLPTYEALNSSFY